MRPSTAHPALGRARKILLALLFFGMLMPFLVSFVGRGFLGTCLALAAWGAWAVLPIYTLLVEVTSGVVLGEDGATYRSREPVRFWAGVITHLTLTSLFAIGASFVTYAYFFLEVR